MRALGHLIKNIFIEYCYGGFAGTITNLLKVMVIDYVRVFQNTTVDTQAPIDFTAKSEQLQVRQSMSY
jgi:hypothetical protein